MASISAVTPPFLPRRCTHSVNFHEHSNSLKLFINFMSFGVNPTCVMESPSGNRPARGDDGLKNYGCSNRPSFYSGLLRSREHLLAPKAVVVCSRRKHCS